MIAQELEVSLHMAFVEARQKRHEFITVEHLLLALLDNPTAAEVLRSCGANMDELRKNLTQHITEQTPRIAADRENRPVARQADDAVGLVHAAVGFHPKARLADLFPGRQPGLAAVAGAGVDAIERDQGAGPPSAVRAT